MFGQGYPPSYPPPGQPPYPPGGPMPYPPNPGYGAGPAPIGFVDMPQPTFFQPSMPPQSGPYAASGYPPHPPPSFEYPPSGGYLPTPSGSVGGGFPIAPSGAGYPPSGYPPSGYAPPPPSSGPYPPVATYPPSGPYPSQPPPPSYPPSTRPSYPGDSNGLYPNLNQMNNTQNYPGAAAANYPAAAAIPTNPTLRPHQPFNPNEDAHRLYKAMKGLGTDEAALIDVLCRRTSPQRQEIALAFKASYGKDLQRNIESETSGDFRNVLVALLKRPMALEAEYLRDSVAGFGTNEAMLIDILCTKSNAEMIELRNAYRQLYNRHLEEDVKDDVSGYFKRFLVSLMAANRNENQPPDFNRAAQQARELHAAGEKRLGTDEVVFNRIFATESYPQLRLIFDEYQKLTRHPIENAIKNEMSSSVEQAFLTLIQYVRSPAGFYAQRLNDSMRGMGTRDKMLIRICVLRSEVDMQEIKFEFQRRFGRPLEAWIRSDCSGDYRRALLCLIGDPRWK